MAVDLTEAIERMEPLEARLGIRLSGLYAELHDDGDLTVTGEVTVRSGQQLQQAIHIVAAVYDAKGRVIAEDDRFIADDEFFAFQTFQIYVYGISQEIARIRVYPRPS